MIVHNTDPYKSSRIDALAKNFVDASGISPRDFLLIDPYSIGDVYHTLALVDEFRRRHCAPDQKIHLICNSRCIPVAQIFNNIERCVGLDCGPYELALEAFAQRYPLAPGFPIVLQPDMYHRGWLGRLVNAGNINMLEAKKLLLDLDLDTPPGMPRVSEAMRQEAFGRARAQGLVENSVIVFNHANTVDPVDPGMFEVLKERFGENVFYDATANGRNSVPWAKPLQIELVDLPFYAELAGNVVALRSGIVDILSSAACNLVTLYPNAGMIKKGFPDPASVARTVGKFTLDNLKLRPHLPEHALFVAEGEQPASVAGRLREVMQRVAA